MRIRLPIPKERQLLHIKTGLVTCFFGEYIRVNYGLPLPLFVPSTLYSFLLKGLQLAFRLGCVMGPNIPGLESPYWEWSSEYNERERLLGVHVQINPRWNTRKIKLGVVFCYMHVSNFQRSSQKNVVSLGIVLIENNRENKMESLLQYRYKMKTPYSRR